MNVVLDGLKDSPWQSIIQERVSASTLNSLSEFLLSQQKQGKTIYPEQRDWFRALIEVPPEQVRVVILGQDPYHGPGQAQGRSFSVPVECKIPPSLRNIFKEQTTDLGISNLNGDLSGWAAQGVLLLNAIFTVQRAKAGSHSGQGWETISDALIQAISEQQTHVVFLLWGAYAAQKKSLIDDTKHRIFTAAHPSPLSAHRGFLGCQHFSKTNQYLRDHGYSEINWRTDEHEQFSLL